MKKGYYRGIPIWVEFENSLGAEIEGRNWFYDILVNIALWIDVEILMVDGFDVWVED